MTLISKDELLAALEKKYGNLNDDCGAYAHTDNGYEWLSIKRIADIIDNCTEYED